jgi:hypothetical protein
MQSTEGKVLVLILLCMKIMHFMCVVFEPALDGFGLLQFLV